LPCATTQIFDRIRQLGWNSMKTNESMPSWIITAEPE